MIISLMLAFLLRSKNVKAQFYKFPLHFSISSIAIVLLFIGLFDSRLDFFTRLIRPINYFLENFIIVFLTFFYVKSMHEVRKIYNFILICFLFFSLYGIVNYLTGISSYTSFIAETYNTRDFGNGYSINGDERLRISSFAWHPIYYGFLVACAILILIFIYSEKRMQVYSTFFYSTLFGLLIMNLFWTNSRTPLLALIIGLCYYYLFAFKFGNKIKIALTGIIALFFVISVSPNALKLVDESINTFTAKGSKLEGSSLEMREMQMGASLLIFNQNPIFGNGFNYITENLGFSSDEKKRSSDNEFQGFESYSYKLLIEQGLIGILGNVAFFISILVFFLKKRKKVNLLGKKIIHLSLGMFITFLLFIFGTGDMGVFLIFMSLLGVNIKAIVLLANRTQENIQS